MLHICNCQNRCTRYHAHNIQTRTHTHTDCNMYCCTHTDAHAPNEAAISIQTHTHSQKRTTKARTHACSHMRRYPHTYSKHGALKETKKGDSTHPHMVSNTTQKHPWRQPESEKALKYTSTPKKINFGRPGPPSCTPKKFQIAPQNDAKTTKNQHFIRGTKYRCFPV